VDLDEFRANVIAEVTAWAAADRNFQHSSFLDVVVPYLEEAGDVADFEACYFRGVGLRRRNLAIDGYAFDDADDSLRLFLASAHLRPDPPTLSMTDARAAFGTLTAFAEEAFSGRVQEERDLGSPEWSLAGEMVRRQGNLARIRAYLLTDLALSSKAKDWPEGELSGIPVEYHIWDIARFHRVQMSKVGRDDIVIDLRDAVDGGLACIEAGAVSDDYRAYLCAFPGAVLAGLYLEHGSRLLEGNVRSFLMTKGKVNKGIRNTILNNPRMFFAYNNGIGATAASAEVERSTDGSLRLVAVTDLQIVNGGQTTASLASAMRNDRASLSSVFVPMKLSVIAPEQSSEMIPLISRFANSQNTVSEADFFSNHPFHRRLEEISRRILMPPRPGSQHDTHWFYERARGQYMNEMFAQSLSARRRFQEVNPRDQVVTKTDLAKAEVAWREQPHTVSKGAQKNFLVFAEHISKEWVDRPEVFHEEYFRTAVAHVILYRALEKLVLKEPWYSGGYRANVVAYAVAKLARMIREHAPGRVLDVGAIWKSGSLTPALIEQVRAIAAAMHAVITDPPAGLQNVTEWSKRQQCWERATAVSLGLEPAFRSELVDASAKRETERAARTQQRQDSTIGDQEAVVKLGPDYWRELRNFGREHQFLTAEDESLLRRAIDYTPGVPDQWQSAKLLRLKERFELEGFPPRRIE
jgi:AIPR protein